MVLNPISLIISEICLQILCCEVFFSCGQEQGTAQLFEVGEQTQELEGTDSFNNHTKDEFCFVSL